MTYGSRVARHMDKKKGRSQKAIMYDAEEHWHPGLASEERAIADIGDRVRSTTLYICKGDGRLRQLELEREAGIEEKWIGVSLEYWHLTMTGTYMRRRWISPFDLRES